jgi:hypothetical protein
MTVFVVDVIVVVDGKVELVHPVSTRAMVTIAMVMSLRNVLIAP